MRRPFVAVAIAASVALSALTATSANAAPSSITGGGSSFQASFEYKCRQAYNAKGGTQVSYDGTLGSGTGMTNLASGDFSFAGTDGPDLTKIPNGQTAIVVPISAAPIGLIYNVKGINNKRIKGLRLTSGVLSDILKGTVQYWDDAKIKSINPSVKSNLKHTRIVPLYRANGSGTTKNLTQYLLATNPSAGWTATKDFVSSNSTLASNGTSQANSDEMVNSVQDTNGAIGYADLPDTDGETGFDVALLRNAKGQYIDPSAAAGSKFVAAAAASKFKNSSGTTTGFIVAADATSMFTQSISGAYQLTAFTYVQASATNDSAGKNAAVRTYVKYALKSCQGKAGYSSLSGSALTIAKAQADLIGRS